MQPQSSLGPGRSATGSCRPRTPVLCFVGKKARVVGHRGSVLLPLVLLLRDQAGLFKQVFFDNSPVIKRKMKERDVNILMSFLEELESFVTVTKPGVD